MFRSLSDNIANRLSEQFYPITIGGVTVSLALVLAYLPDRFAVFGLYALLGLGAGAAIFYGSSETSRHIRSTVDGRLYRTGVFVTSAVTLGIVALTGEAILVAIGLVIGYALVVRQLFAHPTPERVVPQLIVLFLLSPAAKYLTAGRYIGHGDLLAHTRMVEDILVAGSLGALSYTSYQEFPGLHLIAATVGSLSGLGAYDGILLTGLVAYTLVIPAVYVITFRLTDEPLLALSTAFAIALLDDLSFFVSYAFPQSIATVLIIVLALLASMVSRDAIKWRVVGMFVIITAALSVTHHLTQVLFLPVVLCISCIYAAHGKDYAMKLLKSRQFLLFGIAISVNGIRLWQTSFFDRISDYAVLIFQSGLFGGYTESVALGFGTTPPSATVSSAIEWLASAHGLYIVLLLMVFSIGVAGYLRASRHSAAYAAIAWTGILGAIIVFETPISIKSLTRIRLSWLYPFAFVIGIGLFQLRRSAGTIRRRQVILVALVVLAAATPLVTADDYYGLDPRPTSQTSFSDQEYTELQATTSFVAQSDEPTTVFWHTRLAMERSRITGLQRPRLHDRTLMLSEGHFVYRSAWTDHEVTFTIAEGGSIYANDLYVSDRWLSDRAGAENKVYTAGGTGVLWHPTERPFGNESSDENRPARLVT